MKHKPTSEQVRIFKYIKDRPENILIKAFAGCGKTSTVIEGIKYIPSHKSVTYLAFNRHIKEEVVDILPKHVRCYTTYGIGLAALKKVYNNIEFDEFKIDKLIKATSSKWDLDEDFKTKPEIDEYLTSMKQLVNLCRLTLTLKPDYVPVLAARHEIIFKKDRDLKRLMKLMEICMADRTYFDYTDMIFLPAIDTKIWFYQQDYVVVDEIQDLNMCQIRIVEKVLKRSRKTKKIMGRLIAVGDAFQNIYGFNGCTEKSFEWFEKLPNTQKLMLSTSFRCSKNVIKKAQTIVPDINALENAPDGVVRDGDVLSEAQDGDFVLCRSTAPLIELFFEILSDDKKVMIKGSDVGLSLIRLIGKFQNIENLINHWNDEIIKFSKELRDSGILDPREHTGFVALDDKVRALNFLAKKCTTIPELINKINSIFSDDLQGIVLSTVHKVKGLEANRVFIIRPDLLPLQNVKEQWQYQQEKNLEYVAYTRARHELIFDRVWTNE